MEEHRADFPMANIDAVLAKFSSAMYSQMKDMKAAFERIDSDGTGQISFAEFKKLVGHFFKPSEVTEQEMLTIMRNFDSDANGSLSFDEFAGKIAEAAAHGGQFQRMESSFNESKYAE